MKNFLNSPGSVSDLKKKAGGLQTWLAARLQRDITSSSLQRWQVPAINLVRSNLIMPYTTASIRVLISSSKATFVFWIFPFNSIWVVDKSKHFVVFEFGTSPHQASTAFFGAISYAITSQLFIQHLFLQRDHPVMIKVYTQVL